MGESADEVRSRDPPDLSIAETSSLIRSGAISPVDLVRAQLDRIAAVDDALHAFTHVAHDAVASAARAEREIRAGEWRGPLHGISFGVKDIIDVAGLRTSCGSRLTERHVAEEDATVVARLKKAGGIFLGKLALTEFGTGGVSFDLPWPPVHNPWDLDTDTGGSSSGPAAAVAAGLVQAAIGADTAGSIRAPAALCGVTGMKPTYGRISTTGVFPLAPSLDHVGPMTRNVADNRIVLEAISDAATPASPPNPDEDTGSIAGLRIGIIQHSADDLPYLAFDQAENFEKAIAAVEGLGAEIAEASLPSLAEWKECGEAILASEAYAIHRDSLRDRPRSYSERTRLSLMRGAALTAREIEKAWIDRRRLTAELERALGDVDALLGLSTARLPHLLDEVAKAPRPSDTELRIMFNLTGMPALAIPTGFTRSGMPTGMQIATRRNEETLAYRIGQAYEAATGQAKCRPPLPAAGATTE